MLGNYILLQDKVAELKYKVMCKGQENLFRNYQTEDLKNQLDELRKNSNKVQKKLKSLSSSPSSSKNRTSHSRCPGNRGPPLVTSWIFTPCLCTCSSPCTRGGGGRWRRRGGSGGGRWGGTGRGRNMKRKLDSILFWLMN